MPLPCEDQFDVYQSILVHSCALVDSSNGTEQVSQPLIDENGSVQFAYRMLSLQPPISTFPFSCSAQPNLLETPQYVNHMKAFSRGVALRGTGMAPMVRLRCTLRFCDRLMGECEDMLVSGGWEIYRKP